MVLASYDNPLAVVSDRSETCAAFIAGIEFSMRVVIDACGLATVSVADLNLNRVATRYNLAAADPLVPAGAARTNFVGGFRWNAQDGGSATWVPQGLSGSGDATDSGRVAGRKWLLATWYDKASENRARVSFVDATDLNNIRYRHVLLVEPFFGILGPTFRDVAIHAGGLVWYKDYVYVVDTHRGLRVFDTTRIKEVRTGNPEAMGGTVVTGYQAHDYRYILPQIAWYYRTPLFNARWSFCGLDRSQGHQLLTGEYLTTAERRADIYWWQLGNDGWLMPTGGAIRPELICRTTRSTLQGAVSRRVGRVRTVWASSTGADHLFRDVVDDPNNDLSFDWPHQPEGLTMFPDDKELWTITEQSPSRIVFGVRLGGW